jgi:hypothetical protein
MLVEQERPIIIDEYTIQVTHTPIVLASEFHISYLEVEAIRKNHARKLRIADVDAKKGIIYLLDRVCEQDEVLVRYAYYEKWYTYRGFLADTMDKKRVFFHLDCNPSPGHKTTIARRSIIPYIPAMTHLQSYSIEEQNSKVLLAKPVYLYLRPVLFRTTDGNIIEGTQQPYAIYHTDEEHWFNPDDYNYDPSLFRLGKIIVQANSTKDQDMMILDTRSRGGGLDEALSKEIIETVNKESLYHWDIGYFDGEAYQENGVIIIRLPKTILEKFSESEVQSAVAKHKAYGVLPIIEYYQTSQLDRHQKNLLWNPEFYDGEHLTYHNPALDRGQYEIDYIDMGTGDNYILVMHDNARYGITIPGYLFDHYDAYRVEIKAKKDANAVSRSAATIEVVYQDQSKQTYQAPLVNQSEWAIYKQVFTKQKPIQYVNILLNDSNPIVKGNMYVDYVLVFPHLLFDPTQTEVIQI